MVGVGEGRENDGVRLGRYESVPDRVGVAVSKGRADTVPVGLRIGDMELVGDCVPVGLGVRCSDGRAVPETLPVVERVGVTCSVMVPLAVRDRVCVSGGETLAVAVVEGAVVLETERDPEPEPDTEYELDGERGEWVQVRVCTEVVVRVSVGDCVNRGVADGLWVRLQDGLEDGGEAVWEAVLPGDGVSVVTSDDDAVEAAVKEVVISGVCVVDTGGEPLKEKDEEEVADGRGDVVGVWAGEVVRDGEAVGLRLGLEKVDVEEGLRDGDGELEVEPVVVGADGVSSREAVWLQVQDAVRDGVMLLQDGLREQLSV